MSEAIVRFLLEPLLRGGALPHPWHVLDWDTDAGISLTLGGGQGVLFVELERRDEARPCWARTGRFDVFVRPRFEPLRRLTGGEEQVMRSVVAAMRRKEHLLPEIERLQSGRRAALRRLEVTRLLVREGHGHYALAWQ